MVERRTEFFNGKKRHEIVYGISSLTAEQASAQQLLELNRGHWEIENRVHYVRDVTFDEDRSQVRKGNGAQVMASIRNLVIAILRIIGFRYIPDAIRYFVFRIPTALTVLGI
jgi:predicted transposase YbfD/YdcC